MEQKSMDWQVEKVELVFLDLRTITSVGVEIKVNVENGTSIECVLPLLTHPKPVEETKRLMAEFIDPFEIKEYVRSSIETMVRFKTDINSSPQDTVESYFRFTEGVLYGIVPEKED